MPTYLLVILIFAVSALFVTLFSLLAVRRKNRNSSRALKIVDASSDTWSTTCKVCNTHLAFDSAKPLPKIWYCPSCGSKNYTQPLDMDARKNDILVQDTPAAIQKEILSWNWGAFLLGWIWAISNRLWIWLPIGLAANAISLIPGPDNKTVLISMICQAVISVVLGVKGSEWAWKSKKWDSIAHFKSNQDKWRVWGIAFTAAGFLIGFIIGGTSL